MTDESTDTLERQVGDLKYKAGWSFKLVNSPSLFPEPYSAERPNGRLIISMVTEDSLGRGPVVITHELPVPPFQQEKKVWRRWLLEQIVLVERHEACEFFQVGGDKPFFPDHTPGANPYAVLERDAA